MSKDNFIIKDNNSQIISILPKEWVEPLVIISRVDGFDGIDSFVLSLIKNRLEMFVDERDGLDFKKYMQTIEGLEGIPDIEPTTTTTEDESNSSEFVKDVQENYHDMKKSEDKDKEDLR